MRLKFEKERDKKELKVKVLIDGIKIGSIKIIDLDKWRLKLSFEGRTQETEWPSLDQAQNEVRRIVGK